jgi:hypothetical protein
LELLCANTKLAPPFRWPCGRTEQGISIANNNQAEQDILAQILSHNGDLTLTLAGWWWPLRAGAGPGLVWMRSDVCAAARFWGGRLNGLPAQSVVVGEVGRCVGVRWRAGELGGGLHTWSGPVDPEFQGRLRFSYDSMPGQERPGQQIKDIIIISARSHSARRLHQT